MAHQGLGAVSNAHAGNAEHGNIVGAIADCDNLLKRNPLATSNFGQQQGLASSVDDRRDDPACHLAIDYFQFIRMNGINAQALLQRSSKERESAGENGRLVAKQSQRLHKAFRPFGQRNAVQQAMGALRREPLEKRDTAGKTFIESQLSAHGRFGDTNHLVSHARHLCKLVNHFALNERRIHVESKEPAITAEDAFTLKCNINGQSLRGGKKRRAHGHLARTLAADSQLHAGVRRLGVRRKLSREAIDPVDVHVVCGDDSAHLRKLFGGNRTAKHGNNEMVRSKPESPVLDRILRNHFEMRLETEFASAVLQCQFERGQDVSRRNFKQNSQGKVFMHHRLPNVENIDVVLCQDPGQGGSEPRCVGSREVN